MARCGCTTFPTCSCVIVGDTVTTTVSGSGHATSPYAVSVKGYPNPRPIGSIYREQGISAPLALVSNVSTVIVQQYSVLSQPSMWDGSTKLIAPLAGTYILDAGSIGGASGSSVYSFLNYRIRLNGVSILASKVIGANNTFGASGSTSTVHRLIAGDYIELLIYLGIISGSVPTIGDSYLEMRWMGL